VTTPGKELALHSFSGTDGQSLPAGLTLGTDGNFYGVADGGELGLGLLFRVSSAGSYANLRDFTGGLGKWPEEDKKRASR